ncbi:sodium-dependent transporter [Candidatus Bathyarchaeota archaeon]|nr:MAG: sodium-dependent transporter [Candidatus Bathyarchaeota archaeon]
MFESSFRHHDTNFRTESCFIQIEYISVKIGVKDPSISKEVYKSEMSQACAGVRPRPVWTSQRAYILASVAGVVGLGNLWRFPYMVGENGGGTFVFAYVICIFALGIPLYVLESGAGKMINKGPVGLFRQVNSRWGQWLGWAIVLLTTAIMSYYLVISGWTLGYAVDAISINIQPFEQFSSGFSSLWFFLATAVFTLVVLLRGLVAIERMGKILLPLLVLVVGGLAIYAQTLPGGEQAREFYFNFDMATFLEPRTWQMGAAQAFYSLAIGQGFLITYGSYSPQKFNIMKSSSSIALTNSIISITAGLMVFPIVYTFGIALDIGSQLSFTAFPSIFGQLSGGWFIGIAFYVLLFIAAFTSCVGGITVVLTTIRDEFNISLRRAALFAVAIVTFLGIPSALSFTSMELAIEHPFSTAEAHKPLIKEESSCSRTLNRRNVKHRI